MTAPHLDDEQLSALLDEGSGDPHLASCVPCSARLDDLASAQRLLATPPRPLDERALDALIGRALEAFDDEPAATTDAPAHLATRRTRRRPPPSWLLTAAAALAALVGVAGLLRASDAGRNRDESFTAALDADTSAEGGKAAGGGATLESAAPGASVESADRDPEVVGADLGDQNDPQVLTALLRSADEGAPRPTTTFSARTTSGADNVTAESDAPVVGSPTAGGATAAGSATPSATAAAPATTAPSDRARCRAEAERIGAGRLGGLVSTSALRWKGEPAEVLVFLLAEPAGGVTRQALVLSRPACGLLADPRF